MLRRLFSPAILMVSIFWFCTPSTLCAAPFIRGDANLDGSVNVADAVTAIGYLFNSTPLGCLSAVDSNDSGALDIADPITLLAFLFTGGPPLPAPFPLCGDDPTPDALTCDDPGSCSSVPLPGRATYSGPQLTTPRYGHTATALADGLVLIVGGTDDRHLSAIATVEVFDEGALVAPGEPTPATIAGDFIDQDIDGNLIALPGAGRFFHTATRLDDGRVVVIGGTDHVLTGVLNDRTAVFDPVTRSFSEPVAIADEISIPRVRHTVSTLPNGQLLIVGGQEFINIVIPVPPGNTQPAYPSERSMEIFDPSTLSFSLALDSSFQRSELINSRGRAGHTAVSFAGVDNILNSADDVIGVIGGFQTLSAASLQAPQDLLPWQVVHSSMNSMSFYSVATGTVDLAQGLVLNGRVNDPIATNLGRDHAQTPFGDLGMSNVVLVHGGDSNGVCPDGISTSGTTDLSELIVATYTGFGPANGAQFHRFTGAPIFDSAGGALRNTAEFGSEGAFFGCVGSFSRSRTQGVLIDMLRTYDGQIFESSVVVTAGGIDVSGAPGACVTTIEQPCALNQLQGFSFYDPFFDAGRIGNTFPLDDDVDNDGIPDLFPWEFVNNATPDNPLGIRGSWLNYDAHIPDNTIAGYADGLTMAEAATVALLEPRAMHTMTRIAGEDGVVGTIDDRVLVVGGTDEYFPMFGGTASSISCEVFVPPDAGL